MFSFFKRSKSQKGKQKHEKLQLAPQQPQSPPPPPPKQLQPASNDGGVVEQKSPEGDAALAERGVKLHVYSPAAVGASKVASDANAGANGRSAVDAGDEEKWRAKNKNNPHRPQPAATERGVAVNLLPSSCTSAKGADVALEIHGPRAPIAAISPSGPTYQSGSVTRHGANDGSNGSIRENEFSPDNDDDDGDDDGGGDRESSSPIDDSSGCCRQQWQGTQPNATSSNPYAPPSESAMAKGKSRRRGCQQPQQQQQQQVQSQQQQKQQVKAQQTNALRRGDSSGLQETVGKNHTPPKAMSIVVVERATPIKVMQEFAVERQPAGGHLTNGDVTEEARLPGDADRRDQIGPDAVTEKPEPARPFDSGVRDRGSACQTAKTHTFGGESVALVLPCAGAPEVTAGASTNTSSARKQAEALLNIKNISPTTGEQGGCASVDVVVPRDTDGRARVVGAGPGRCEIDSSEPAAIPAISEANAVVGNSSAEETLAVVKAAAAAAAKVQEMGQQPSRADSEPQQRSSSTRASKSSSPQQPPRDVPSPPPRTQRSPTSHLQVLDLEAIARKPTTTIVHVEQDRDAPGDDTSDDRDVFYEAKETLSPPIAPTGGSGELRFDGGVANTAGTPDPIRASLVLKITDAPISQQQRRHERRKKQVSFKLTQNGSDDVEVTSVNSSEGEDEEEEAGDDSESEAERQCAPSPTNHVKLTHDKSRPFAPNHTAFSESTNSKQPSTFGGICSFERENYIEFQYDNSAPTATTPDGGPESGKKGPPKDAPESASSSVGVLIEDSVASLPDVVQQPGSIEPHGKIVLPPTSLSTVEKINSEMKDLVNQECRYSAKLEEAEKRVNDANAKVYDLQQKLDSVERDALLKEYNVERLQAELVAALKECDGIRARLTTQQAEMESIRLKASEREDELNLRYQNLEVEQLELNEKLKEVRHLAHDLNSQLIDAKSEVDRLKAERQKLLDERTEEQKIMREALEESVQQRTQVEAKWKHDFEQLRNVNNDREEHLMQDCEFTVRNMQKTCKEKVEAAARERKQAFEKLVRLEELTRKQTDEVRHLKSYEAEVEQLRGLTYDQKETMASMTRQIEGLKAELQTAYNRIEAELVKVQQIKNRCEYQLCEKEREALNRIEIARGEIAMQWEDRLLHEMNRLKVELEQMHMEERTTALEKIRCEALAETEALSQRFNESERHLKNEIESLQATIEQQKVAMANAQSDADQKLLQSRMYVERAERENEQTLAREMAEKDEIIDNLKRQFEKEKLRLEDHFTDRIQQVQQEFAREISDTTEMMKSAHKKELEDQSKTLIAEKEKAMQLMESRNRNRLEDAENKIRDLTTGHQRQLKDLQEEQSFIVNSLESRDTKNAQEIQTLHKKCRCLTNLFDEMRLRYERREPRPEDLQQIEELRRVIDSQDRDLRLLTETLREMQLEQMQQERQKQTQNSQQPPPPPRRSKPNRGKQTKQQPQQQQNKQQQQKQQEKKTRPQYQPPEPAIEQMQPDVDEDHAADAVEYIQPPVLIPPAMLHRTTCDVIYEENEADILREEEESQQNEEGEEAQREVASEAVDEETAADYSDTEDQQANDEETGEERTELTKAVMVVDLPESAIQTEDRMVQSTTPTIIDELETEDDTTSEFTTTVPIENVTETCIRPRESSAPRIVITDDTEKETNDSDCGSTVVEISEEPRSVSTIIELPAVFAKIYPSESAGDGTQKGVPCGPEMTVIRVSEGRTEGSL